MQQAAESVEKIGQVLVFQPQLEKRIDRAAEQYLRGELHGQRQGEPSQRVDRGGHKQGGYAGLPDIPQLVAHAVADQLPDGQQGDKGVQPGRDQKARGDGPDRAEAKHAHSKDNQHQRPPQNLLPGVEIAPAHGLDQNQVGAGQGDLGLTETQQYHKGHGGQPLVRQQQAHHGLGHGGHAQHDGKDEKGAHGFGAAEHGRHLMMRQAIRLFSRH